MKSPKYLYRRLLLAVIVIQYSFAASAQVVTHHTDTLSGTTATGQNFRLLSAINSGRSARYAERKDKFSPDLPEEEPALFQNPDAGFSNFRERKQLMAYLQQLSVDENTAYNQTKIKRLYRLARFFTRLRLYPLAMKCFFKTIAVTNAGNADTTLNPVQATDSAVNYADAGYLNVDAKDDSVVEKQINLLKTSGDKAEKSKPIGYEQIVNTFNDGKKAVAYALIFHVKQPVRGKRKIFVWSNTGHTFITLIKYNSDSTYASISFGFYPKKDNILSATPIIPLTSSVFKNDSGHDWDEVLGKFISKRRFDKILLLANEYNHFQYHLSKNNCTDFGLRAASVGGLNIWDTSGSWPLGSGNNPGVTGQSIINGKFKNAETGDNHHLLVDVIPQDSSNKK